jgi:16S rRNA G527 N7-methylase RsmG
MNSKDAFNLVKTLDFNTVLDVGSGGGEDLRVQHFCDCA